jgi:flagellar motor switch protein FliN/FliY
MSGKSKRTEPGLTEMVKLEELAPQAPAGPALLGANLRLLDGVQVDLSVVVGTARTSLGELMALQENAILKIDRKADYPVDVMLNGNVVARGQLVVVDDNFGVRITEVAQAVPA